MQVESRSRDEFILDSSALLTALANANRLRIMDILTDEEISVGALAEKIGLGQSALSQHLALLRGAGLVRTRRDGLSVYYRSTSEPVRKILEMLLDVADTVPRGSHAA